MKYGIDGKSMEVNHEIPGKDPGTKRSMVARSWLDGLPFVDQLLKLLKGGGIVEFVKGTASSLAYT